MPISEDILTSTPPKPDARIPYGTDPNHFLDLRQMKTKGPHPAAIFIHGGYWRAKYDLEYLGHACAALASRGITTANLEYRRAGNPGGGWPGTFADIRSAYQFLIQNAARYEIDPHRVIVVGHSAGGQLALCLAAHEPALKTVVSLAGVIDLQRAYELHLSNDAVVEFLGGTPKEAADHYREADPMKLSIKTRQFIIHGAQDDTVPPQLSRNYVNAKKKEDSRLVMIENAGHFDVVDPKASAWQEIEKLLVQAV